MAKGKKLKRKPTDVELEDFIAEVDMVIHQLEMAKREAKKAQRYAVDGKVPMYGMFSWGIVVDRARSLHNAFKRSWPIIKDRKKQNANA